MDVFSYKLGKKAGGGGGNPDLSKYFNTEIKSNTASNSNMSDKIVKNTAPFTVDENVTDLQYCFYNCNFENLDVSTLDTSNITNMRFMFSNCMNLKNINVSNWDVSKVVDFNNMFTNCQNLTKIDLSKWNTTGADYRYMLSSCVRLAVIDISNFQELGKSMFTSTGSLCLQSDGAYADGIPYVYVNNSTIQSALVSGSYGAPSSWSTANVVIKS